MEDAVFRVPRHLFLMPNAQIEPVPQGGDTGDDLVKFGEEVKKDDFLQLLRAIYPRCASDRFKYCKQRQGTQHMIQKTQQSRNPYDCPVANSLTTE